jgi:hypothetical protein
LAFDDFRAQMAAAGWNLATHQLRLGSRVLQSSQVHDKSA